jgi:stromal membrane-associated protein
MPPNYSGQPCASVKSIDLDIWQPEQLAVCPATTNVTVLIQRKLITWLATSQNIKKWGNRRANLYWERHLKAGHVPPEQ